LPSLSGSVLLEGEACGTVSGEYVDESQDASSENIEHRTIDGQVLLEGERVDNGAQLEYDDYVTYGDGGTRTIPVTGNVWLYVAEAGYSALVGECSGSLDDNYGAVTKIPTTLTLEVIPL